MNILIKISLWKGTTQRLRYIRYSRLKIFLNHRNSIYLIQDNVDTLFSRKILPEKQAEFVNRILTIVGQLLISMEAEKQYLVLKIFK